MSKTCASGDTVAWPVSAHTCSGILPSPTPPMAGQTRCLAKVWQAGHLFLLLIPREHGHLVGCVTRGPKSLSDQGAKVIVTRLRDLEEEILKPWAGQFVLHIHLLQLALLSLSWTQEDSTLILIIGGQGNRTRQVQYLWYLWRIHLPVLGECDYLTLVKFPLSSLLAGCPSMVSSLEWSWC